MACVIEEIIHCFRISLVKTVSAKLSMRTVKNLGKKILPAIRNLVQIRVELLLPGLEMRPSWTEQIWDPEETIEIGMKMTRTKKI